jgi:hypothetical protein
MLWLQPYNFQVEYRTGKFNHVPDAVTRSPIPTDSNEVIPSNPCSLVSLAPSLLFSTVLGDSRTGPSAVILEPTT